MVNSTRTEETYTATLLADWMRLALCIIALVCSIVRHAFFIELGSRSTSYMVMREGMG